MISAPHHSASGRPSSPTITQILATLAAIILGAFMSILDATIVNVALPTFGRVFETSIQSLQWIITGYMLASAAVIPISGWLSDRYGSKRVYLTALVMFTLGSALCAAATTAPMLALFRVIQGLGGGMLMPVGMAVLFRVSPPEKRGAVMGIFGIPMLLGPALGPVISGWLLEIASWPWIFLINVPVGVVAVYIGIRSLPSFASESSQAPLDLVGLVLGPIAFSALTYGISESTEYGWTGLPTLVGVGVGFLALIGFVARQLTTAHPLIELRVFTSRDFSVAILAQWLMIFGMFGTFFLIPVFLQQVRGYSPLQTGLLTLPNAVVAACTMPLAGRLFDRFGARPPVVVGLSIVVVAFWLLSGLNAGTTTFELILALAIMGGGMGMAMMPLGTHVLNTAPRNLVSRVTSLSGACQNVVSSLAVATFATLLQGRMLANAAGSAQTTTAQAQAFGDVYGSALWVIVFAALVVLTLRRPAPNPHGGQHQREVVSSVA
ncbi:MAG: DHA2 family efflux MFS transporter permease subunit [Chloroflexi bacterium]|nr:DHA2 family efflux MFS transporter permease subunit [Chloroflexota bacterium]